MRDILRVNNYIDMDKYTDEMRIDKFYISTTKSKLFVIQKVK